MLRDWTVFERAWLLVFGAINLYLFFAWGDSLLGLTASLTGMLCVVLAAKGKISNYYFGIVQTTTYAYISYTYGLYGETMLNGLFYLPLQFVGIAMWRRRRAAQSVAGEDVAVKRLNARQWAGLAALVPVSIALYALLLAYLRGRNAWIDSSTNVLSIAAQFLMLGAYAEQWLFWIAVNVLSITLWFLALTQQGGSDWTVLVMWSAFLVNSVYGYLNWLRLYRQQTQRCTAASLARVGD